MEHPVFERDPSQKTEAERKEVPPLLKLALELGPLLVFFFANARGESLIERFPVLGQIGEPIFLATALFMVATVIALAISWSMTRTLPMMPLISGIVVLVFGALTLWLHNDTFIKMKPTIVNTLFGAILLGGLLFGKSLLGYVFDSAFKLDAEGWRKLTFRWGLFFIFLAIANEVVWRNFSTDAWVSFKVWGIMPITIVFTLSQMPLIQKHTLPEAKAE
ncbi:MULTISPECIES: septation protein A [Brucella]|jgi:intracellular septation protein|uniref:Inner membrane-spanning protein YciB n=1 Tax=Brucella pseudogrignonensis TaxID=419475 RepID=A0A1A9FSA3_9HYPH|nr:MULTISPECIES: septation protein A [Brucella]EMG55732.1 intracellular septation protein A [Ochrobactrum sp. CDB2]MQP40065.1 septation protein A [Ochrobactrum sp. MYb237]ANG98055.1 septation protein A [Brucella pseudogrignonensis]KAB2690489.1 septation protein A [Brucella pseudogrignonensis]NNV21608.1 septation protein A [Brucella pseudogrignonensis]